MFKRKVRVDVSVISGIRLRQNLSEAVIGNILRIDKIKVDGPQGSIPVHALSDRVSVGFATTKGN